METYKSLRDQVLYQLDEINASASTRANVNNALNQAHQQRTTEYDWPFMLWPYEETISVVANQQKYTLHQEFDRAFYFKNLTNDEMLVEIPHRNYYTYSNNPNKATQGRHFAFVGMMPVQNQPTSASVLTIVSSSASDVGSTKGVVVRGETSDGVTTEQINPNGLAAVSGLKQFTRIIEVTKLSAWAGTMTMTSNAGAVTNLKLFDEEYGRKYQTIQLLWIPQSSYSIGYKFFRKPVVLSRDNDLTDIPHPYDQILVWDALLILAAYDGTLDTGRVSVWEKNQNRIEMNLYAAYSGGRSVVGQGRKVRLLDELED